ncbi:MAG TPA: hypothetical protein VM818_05125 [Vicinamibacterales bacterium]|nr:hypothetical protein [Vicinamibacterales bacterium]
MPTPFLAGLFVLAATAALSAQTTNTVPPLQSPQTPASPAKALTLVGCVQPDETKPDRFTFWAKDSGTTYRLSGASLKGFEWRNVRIVGGLVPSPNLAAQAGAIDETKVAMAQQGADPQGTRNIEIFEFRVSSVRALSGTCTRKP